jgi:DNA-binding NarL/FixJ family response regulator
LKILIVNDHALFRAGLRLLLAAIGHDVNSLEAASTLEALAMVVQHPDTQLCLLDLDMQDQQGVATIRKIKVAAPHVSVVVISGEEDSATIRSCIDAGATSFVPKNLAPELLTNALQRVLDGAVYVPEQALSEVEASS